MIATVRLDKSLEEKLGMLIKTLHKKKSDVIREAIEIYANSVYKKQQTRIQNAVNKTAVADKQESDLLQSTLNDGL